MDRGFKRWFAQVVVTHIKSKETAIIREERRKRIVEEEKIRQRYRSYGWNSLSWIITGLAWMRDVLFFSCLLVFTILSFGIIFGSATYLICTWQPPVDQCMIYELQNSIGEVILSNETLWLLLLGKVAIWQAFVGHFLADMQRIFFPIPDFNITESLQICRLVADARLGVWERWAGVYKLPFGL
jgi:hypothetical protein